MFQNVPECSRMFQNVPECSRMFQNVPGCCRMFRDVQGCLSVPQVANSVCVHSFGMHKDGTLQSYTYKHVQNCLYKHAVTKECMQLHKPACSYISLYAVSKLACSYISLHAVI